MPSTLSGAMLGGKQLTIDESKFLTCNRFRVFKKQEGVSRSSVRRVTGVDDHADDYLTFWGALSKLASE